MNVKTNGLFIFAFFIIIAAVGLWGSRFMGLVLTWGIIAAIMLVIIGAIGVSLGKGATGIFIDPMSNMMSLSRLQITLWTWVILSAFLTLALARIGDSQLHADKYYCPTPANATPSCHDPLAIQLPPLLWAVMGISLTTAVGAPLLNTAKVQRTNDQEQTNIQRAAKREPGAPAAATYRVVLDQRKRNDPGLTKKIGEEQPLGALVRKDSPRKASYTDLFTGEEVSTFGYVEIAKLQNMFFTIVAVVSYAAALAVVMYTKSVDQLSAFPDLPAGLVALIGISHTGYLVDKASTHSTPEATTTEV
jgi:hypothetical protein